MASQLPLRGNERVIDVAAGTGATAIPLAKHLPHGRVTALDLSPAMLEQTEAFAKQNQLSNIETLEGDFTKLPFEPQSFHHATCAFGLFFVPEMGAALKHIASKVRSSGSVTISGFCGDSFLPGAQLCLDRLQTYGLEVPEQIAWRRMSEPAQLELIFKEAGLKDLKIDRKSFGYHVSLDEWWDVIWNAGLRGLVSQLDEKLEEFKQAHFEELKPLCSKEGLWLEIDVNFSRGIVA